MNREDARRIWAEKIKAKRNQEIDKYREKYFDPREFACFLSISPKNNDPYHSTVVDAHKRGFYETEPDF